MQILIICKCSSNNLRRKSDNLGCKDKMRPTCMKLARRMIHNTENSLVENTNIHSKTFHLTKPQFLIFIIIICKGFTFFINRYQQAWVSEYQNKKISTNYPITKIHLIQNGRQRQICRIFLCQYFKFVSGHKDCRNAFSSRIQHAICSKINEQYQLFLKIFFILCCFSSKDVTIRYYHDMIKL